jgi:hypothetical protein
MMNTRHKGERCIELVETLDRIFAEKDDIRQFVSSGTRLVNTLHPARWRLGDDESDFTKRFERASVIPGFWSYLWVASFAHTGWKPLLCLLGLAESASRQRLFVLTRHTVTFLLSAPTHCESFVALANMRISNSTLV